MDDSEVVGGSNPPFTIGGGSLDPVLFSSKSCEWETPQGFFDEWDKLFNFDLDVCATPDNAKCKRYYTQDDDGLSKEWDGVCWMNPPYGSAIGKWVRKAYESSLGGATVVCLLPARTDTIWFHDYCTHGEIHFVRGRLKFGGSKNSAPFPSMVVIFRSAKERERLGV